MSAEPLELLLPPLPLLVVSCYVYSSFYDDFHEISKIRWEEKYEGEKYGPRIWNV
jgi:hypothetical protein